MKHNLIALKGRVASVDVIKEGKSAKGHEWTLTSVRLDEVDGAGQKDKEAGSISFSTFEKGIEEGAVIGAVCRVTGKEGKFNDDGETRTYVKNYLSATKDVHVIEKAPKKAAKPKKKAEAEEVSEDKDGDFNWDDIE